MRLRRLDLTRYGKFTDRSIDFGEVQNGAPDLHVIYGPNEAGKSTAISAFLDLLFGIDARSNYGFLHPYATMRVGACLELLTGVREVQRIKKTQNSLLDLNGNPVPDNLFAGDLGGIQRSAYETMFSLDDATLETGGNNILASKGDLGQLLFSASAGIGDLSRNLAELKTEADAFYKPRARSGDLADLKSKLVALKQDKERVDTLASHYGQLVVERDNARAQHETANAERSILQSRLDQVLRLRSTLPRLNALRELQSKISSMEDLPELPHGWDVEITGLQADDISLETQQALLQDQIAALELELQELSVDTSALAIAKRLSDTAGMRDRFTGAVRSLPARRLDLRDSESTIAGLLRRLEQQSVSDPGDLILTAKTEIALRALIESRSGIDTTLQSARDEFEQAQLRLQEAIERLSSTLGTAQDDAGDRRETHELVLAPVIARARESDHIQRRRLARHARDEKAEELTLRLSALVPWKGDTPELLSLSIPDPVLLETWKTAFSAAAKDMESREGEVLRLESELTRIGAEAESYMSVSGLTSDADAARVRAQREKAWSLHRAALDASTADSFETALREDDVAMAARSAQAEQVARLNQLLRDTAVRQAELDQAKIFATSARTNLESLKAVILEAARGIGLGRLEDPQPAQLQDWLARRRLALDSLANLKKHEREIVEADEDAETIRAGLLDALRRIDRQQDDTARTEDLLQVSDDIIARSLEAKSLREAVRLNRGDCERRKKVLDDAVAAESDWTRQWEHGCSGCWLGASGTTPPLSFVREILPLLAQLATENVTRLQFLTRIQKMESDQEEFSVAVRALAEELGIDHGTRDAVELFDEIESRVTAATLGQSKKDEKGESLRKLQEKRLEVEGSRRRHDRRKAEMLSYFGVFSLADVARNIVQIDDRKRMKREAGETVAEIVAALEARNFEEAEAELDHADRDALDREAQELTGLRADQNTLCEEWSARYRLAQGKVEAIGGDDTVARIEEQKQTILLNIEERAHRYLRLRIGTAAAEQALRMYRDRHRGSMMARASNAFHTISRGAYAKLATQPDADTEVLVAVGAGGSSKVASRLSKGTRFQLYLSLRVAGYHEFAQTRTTVPFIADDIMETFDDFRAEEAFRLFGEMASVGQVIYFTHHQHLLEIVRKVCSGAKIHHLAPDAPAVQLAVSNDVPVPRVV
jgi:uncharacterized protein YhaN